MGEECQTPRTICHQWFESTSDRLYSKILLPEKHLFSASLIQSYKHTQTTPVERLSSQTLFSSAFHSSAVQPKHRISSLLNFLSLFSFFVITSEEFQYSATNSRSKISACMLQSGTEGFNDTHNSCFDWVTAVYIFAVVRKTKDKLYFSFLLKRGKHSLDIYALKVKAF